MTMHDKICPTAQAVLWSEQGSELWKLYRGCYVTASNYGTILGRNPYRTHEEFCEDLENALLGNITDEHLTPKQKTKKNRSRKNMQWGRDHEKDGVAEYAIRNGLRLAEPGEHLFDPQTKTIYFPGLVVDKGEKLACSPDGLVGRTGCIEVKCPASRRFYQGIPDHYYLQCMGVMGVCDRDWCDFIQWTPTGIRVDRIHFDKDVWEGMKEKLEAFYDNHSAHYACCQAALADFLGSFLTGGQHAGDRPIQKADSSDERSGESDHAAGGPLGAGW